MMVILKKYFLISVRYTMIKSVVFDMDGLMFDTERLAIEAWEYAGKQMGFNITKDIVIKACGFNIENTRRVLLEFLGDDFDFSYCRKIRMDYMTKYIDENGMPVKPGLVELLCYLRYNDYKITIATSTEKERVEYYLESANISSYFGELVCGDMIKRGKPEPDIYLRAVEILGAIPDECIALEDSPPGILSAYRAGIKPVMIPDLIEPDEHINKLLYAKLPSLFDVINLLKPLHPGKPCN